MTTETLSAAVARLNPNVPVETGIVPLYESADCGFAVSRGNVYPPETRYVAVQRFPVPPCPGERGGWFVWTGVDGPATRFAGLDATPETVAAVLIARL